MDIRFDSLLLSRTRCDTSNICCSTDCFYVLLVFIFNWRVRSERSLMNLSKEVETCVECSAISKILSHLGWNMGVQDVYLSEVSKILGWCAYWCIAAALSFSCLFASQRFFCVFQELCRLIVSVWLRERDHTRFVKLMSKNINVRS